MKKCMCGCGQEVTKEGNRFICGHQNRGMKFSKEHKKKISKANKGRILSEETKRKMSEAKKGRNHPFYGKKRTEETKRKTSLNHINVSKENNPNWKGGISFEPYCPKFNNKLKERIRNRDNKTCQLCNKLESNRKLCIHHIHYDKENCYPDLITLCNSCNVKVNYNRDYWEQYFMNILEKRELLNFKVND